MKPEDMKSYDLDECVDLMIDMTGELRNNILGQNGAFCELHAILTRLMPFLIADIILTTIVLAIVIADHFL